MDLIPRMIFWETTKKCSLKCAFCRMTKSESGDELTTAEAFRLIDSIKTSFGSSVLVLSGGEPLLREDIFEIMFYAAQKGLTLALATNGVLLKEKEAGLIKKYGVRRVSLSLDSSDEKKHDSSRGVLGAFKQTVNAADILRKEQIPFQINFTVTKNNLNEIRTIADLALSIKAMAVHYFVLVPVGCGKEIDDKSRLEANDIEEALREIKNISESSSLEIRPTCAPQYVRFSEGKMSGGCLAGTSVLFISSRGYVYPCGYLPITAGNLRKNSIGKVWKGSIVFNALRKNDLRGSCGDCGYKISCRGCRARAFADTGDFMSEDRTCVLAKEAVAS
ncbi:MAG: radical SAM protein [Candidatus Omnitrophica bacterium]|nr:radical SAM protein [Candidatus Omnitrophota bacterium]